MRYGISRGQKGPRRDREAQLFLKGLTQERGRVKRRGNEESNPCEAREAKGSAGREDACSRNDCAEARRSTQQAHTRSARANCPAHTGRGLSRSGSWCCGYRPGHVLSLAGGRSECESRHPALRIRDRSRARVRRCRVEHAQGRQPGRRRSDQLWSSQGHARNSEAAFPEAMGGPRQARDRRLEPVGD